MQDSTEVINCFGAAFAADVIERESQKILVVKEKLSHFVRARIIPDQTVETLREALITMTADMIPDSGTTIRVDGAMALQSLAKESTTDGTTLKRLNITVEVGRLLNLSLIHI